VSASHAKKKSAAKKPVLRSVNQTAEESAADPLAQRILDAAYEQFCLVGIRRTSMEDVARRAKVGRVTIYRKFASNDKLVSALLWRETHAAIAKVEAATRDVADVEARFAEGFVAGVRAVRKHPLLVALLATEPERTLPLLTLEATNGLGLARAFLAQEVRRARKDLGLPATDADYVAEIMARLVHSLVLTPETGLPLDDDRKIRDFARRHIVPMVLAGVKT
jgi:AcrR family transcriptional regulator